MSAATHETITELSEKLRHDSVRARVAHTRLVADEHKAWRRYAGAVAEVLEQLEADLEEGKATLEAQRVARAAERHAAIQPVLDRARGALDELRVQGDLLGMEARDRVEPARETATDALIDVRNTVERLADAVCRSGHRDGDDRPHDPAD